MTTKRIGVNIQAKPDDADLLYRSGLPGVLLYGAALDPGLAQRIKELSPQAVVCLRYVGGNDDFIRDPTVSPLQRANEFADEALRAFERVRPFTDNPIAMGWNEFQVGDLREFPATVLEERAKRYAEGELEVMRRLHAEGYRTIAFNFSRGTPHVLAFDGWSPFKIYEPVLADPAVTFFGYHAYWDAVDAAAGISSILAHDTTTFRYRAMYEELAPAARKPIIFTEFGEDGPGGYKKFSTISNYIAKMRAVEQVWDAAPHFADRYVYLALMFLAGRSDDRWATFDPMDNESDRAAFLEFARRAGPLPIVRGPKEPPVSYPDSYFVAGMPALAKKAYQLDLGAPLTPEWDNGTAHVRQIFQGGMLSVEKEKWDQIELRDPLTGALMAQPKPYGGAKPTGGGYSFPQVLTDVGAIGEAGIPVPGQPFYRLTGATVRTSISAFMVVTVFSKGVPKIGAKVVNLFPDGNGEVIETDGSGNAHFQFGASSAFTVPGTGPFTVFVADDRAFKDSESVPKRVVYQYRLSDVVKSLGDFRGEHTEIYMQFVEQP